MGFRNARRGSRPGETEELQAAIDAAAATAAAAQADADAAAAAAAAADAAAAAAQTDATAAQGTATDAQADAAAAAAAAAQADADAAAAAAAAAAADAAAAAAQTDATAAAELAARKVATFVGVATFPPVAEGTGDLWYVRHPTNANLFLEVRRWNGTSWVDITQSWYRSDFAGNNRVEIGSNPDNPAVGTNDVRFYSAAEAASAPGARIWRDTTAPAPTLTYQVSGAGSFHDFFGKVIQEGPVEAWDGFRIGDSSVGTSVRAWNMGVDIGSTDANSRRAISHTLPGTPDVVLVSNWVGGGTRGQVEVFSRGATSFQVECLTAAGALTGAGVSRATFWLALYF